MRLSEGGHVFIWRRSDLFLEPVSTIGSLVSGGSSSTSDFVDTNDLNALNGERMMQRLVEELEFNADTEVLCYLPDAARCAPNNYNPDGTFQIASCYGLRVALETMLSNKSKFLISFFQKRHPSSKHPVANLKLIKRGHASSALG